MRWTIFLYIAYISSLLAISRGLRRAIDRSRCVHSPRYLTFFIIPFGSRDTVSRSWHFFKIWSEKLSKKSFLENQIFKNFENRNFENFKILIFSRKFRDFEIFKILIFEIFKCLVFQILYFSDFSPKHFRRDFFVLENIFRKILFTYINLKNPRDSENRT